MKSLTEVEKEKNILNLSTIHDVFHSSWDDIPDSIILLSMAMRYFKFGCGGYNGCFKGRNEMIEEMERFIKGLKDNQ